MSQKNLGIKSKKFKLIVDLLSKKGLIFKKFKSFSRAGELFSDPIEFKSRDFNWYRYVNNDPVNHTDPSGLFDPVADAILAPTVDLDKAVEQTDNLFDTMLMLTGIGALAKTLFKEGMALFGKGGIKVVASSVPKLRQEYIEAVKNICKKLKQLRKKGLSEEQIARQFQKERRDIGVEFKNKTPEHLRGDIYKRNLEKYGDEFGPTIDWLRKKKKSWTDIIQSSCKSGGKDIDFNK